MVAIHGQFDGMASDSQRLQQVSTEQGALMSQMGSTLEGLTSTFQGPAGVAMQNIGEQMIQQGQQMAHTFDQQSAMMSNNVRILSTGDEDNAHQIAQIANLIV